jgi:hypothetical protein
MFCKSVKSNRYWFTWSIVGIISLLFGIVGYKSGWSSTGNGEMLLGMFTGLGAAFAATSIFRLLHRKFTPAAKLKQEEIDLKDERNVQILRAAYTIANTAASLLFAVLTFIFVWLDYRVPAFITIGALWIQVIVFFLSYTYFSKKM